MATPIHTVPLWVPNNKDPQILFVTENYPGDPDSLKGNTYFYRTLLTGIVATGANNLLNNLCKAMNIPGINETEKLNNFMHLRTYFLIDTFHSGGG